MKREELVQFIEKYIKQNIVGEKEKEFFHNLLLDKKNSFIAQWDKADGDIVLAIKNAVVGDPGGKTEALLRMKRFSSYLKRQGVEFDVDWPPIEDIGNRYERLVFILREMQTYERTDGLIGENATSYLAAKLWVSERTIDEDFSYLKSPGDSSLPKSIFRESLVINGMKRSKGVVEFASTAHPVFLVENLTSILVMTEALLEKAKDSLYREQAMVTARRIWKQLTPYARERIIALLHEAYTDNSEELRLFSVMVEGVDAETNAFREERTEHMSPMGSLLNAMKMATPCRVEYLKNEWERFEWTGIVRNRHLQNGELVIPEDGLAVSYDDIVMVTLLER